MTPDEMRAYKRHLAYERYMAKPGVAEREKERKRAAWETVKADPERHAAYLEAKREAWARTKAEDPERYAQRLAAMCNRNAAGKGGKR